MNLIKSVFVILVIGTVFSEDVAFRVFEKIWSPETHSERLNAESFTKGVYTVPGYSAKEDKDSSDPPFDPSPECGGSYLNLTEGAFGTITSPNYPHNYPSSAQCEWIIESIPGTVVEATFFDVVTQPWLFSFSDYVSVSDTGSWDKYRRFAGDANHKMPFTIISKENRLSIRFVSSRFLNFRGFKLVYVVRPMKASDESPPTNEFGSAFNNDLISVCSSRPIPSDARINTRFHAGSRQNGVEQRIQEHIRIVNGVESLPHQYPFMVIILTNQGSFCGGSLIDPSHVLTSASCLEASNPESPEEELHSVDLVFGTYNLSNRAENLYARQYRSVQYENIASNVFIHPNFEPKSGANDIAIVRVNAVKITKYVQPIFLPSVYTESNSFAGWTLRTLGWGAVDAKKIQLSPILREASATVIPTGHCREHFSGSVTGNHICTKNPFFKPIEPTIPTTEFPSTSNLETSTHPVEEEISTYPSSVETSTYPVNENEETSTSNGVETSTYPVIGEETQTTELPYSTTRISSVGILEESYALSTDEGNSTEDSEPTGTIAYETPCHGDSGGPLVAEFLENHTENENDADHDPNKAGLSIHDCVNAKQNVAGNPMRQEQQDHACQRPKDSNQKWFVQVGVLSFGSRVCGRKHPVVFTRVTAHLEWISFITGRHG